MLCFPWGDGVFPILWNPNWPNDLLRPIRHDRTYFVWLLCLAWRGLAGFAFMFLESSNHIIRLRLDCLLNDVKPSEREAQPPPFPARYSSRHTHSSPSWAPSMWVTSVDYKWPKNSPAGPSQHIELGNIIKCLVKPLQVALVFYIALGNGDNGHQRAVRKCW